MEIDARSPVRAIVTRDPVMISDTLTLSSLAAVLAADAIGTAIVTRTDGRHGVVSERDVIRALADGGNPDEIWVSDVMSEDLVTVSADERIMDVALRLIAEDIRHAVVLDDERIVGVLSIRDLFQVVVDDLLDTWD